MPPMVRNTAYGNEVEFTATAIVGATVTTAAVTSFQLYHGYSRRKCNCCRSGNVTAKGVCYGGELPILPSEAQELLYH